MTTNDDQRIPKKLCDDLVILVKKSEINTAKALREYRALDAKYDKDTSHQKATIVALRSELRQTQDKLAKAEESLDSRNRLIEYMQSRFTNANKDGWVDKYDQVVEQCWGYDKREKAYLEQYEGLSVGEKQIREFFIGGKEPLPPDGVGEFTHHKCLTIAVKGDWFTVAVLERVFKPTDTGGSLGCLKRWLLGARKAGWIEAKGKHPRLQYRIRLTNLSY
jgi:hypothetical protein